MKKLILIIAITLTSTIAFSQTLMPLPTHTNVYSGIFARGMWFTAPSDFVITGLKVAPEAGTGDQYIHVVKFTGIPTTSTTGASNFTTLDYISAAPNNVIQSVYIPVATGDVIGIIGTVGNIQNSYGNGPFSTTINGASTTLHILGYQGSINSGPAPVMWGVASGSIGRIHLYWDPPITGPNDAGVSKIIEPVDTCIGTYNVQAEISNYGTNQITQVEVNWSINGLIQTPVNYSSLLDTVNGVGNSSAVVNLGSVTLPANTFTDIEAWTSLPNNLVDTSIRNDSAIASVFGFPFPTLDIGPDTTICPGEPITLDAGANRDNILWSNTATSQTITVGSAGTFFVEVDENGCWSYDTIDVTLFPQPPSIDLGPDTTLCFGDSLILDATTAGMTYLWQDNSTNPTFTVKTAGVYSVELEDANTCNSSDAVNVTYYLEPGVTIYVAPSNDVCYGVPQTFTAFPLTQGSIDYQWKINGVNQGPQTTSATFNGPADDGDSVQVDLITDICATAPYPVPSNKIGMTVNPSPKAVNGKTLVKENSTETYAVPLSSGSAYVWRVKGGTISGDSTKNIVTVKWGAADPNGNLVLVEKDVKNCERDNNYTVNIVSIVGVDNIANGFGIGDPYPNPSNDLVNIPIHADRNWNITLELFDMSGKLVKTIFHGTITGDRNVQLSVDDLGNGLYIYKLTTPDGYMAVKKLIVEH